MIETNDTDAKAWMAVKTVTLTWHLALLSSRRAEIVGMATRSTQLAKIRKLHQTK
jgi:hypothetical protein